MELKEKKYRAHQYPLVTRIINRTVVVTSPDFHFPVPVTFYLGTEDLSQPEVVLKLGRAARIAYAQIEAHLEELEVLKRPHPTPMLASEAVPRPPKTVSLTEGCQVTGLKPDALRALGDQGVIEMRLTHGRHRRFLRESLDAYVAGLLRDP